MLEEQLLQTSPCSVSQMSKLRESRLYDQVDFNVDKILKILCKVLVSEAITNIADARKNESIVSSELTIQTDALIQIKKKKP